MSYQGVTMGPGTPFGLKKFEGLGKAPVRKGNTARARVRGSFVGLNLLGERDVTLTLDVGPIGSGFSPYSDLQAALSALSTAMSTEGTTEYPLWLKLPNKGLLCMMARVDKADIPVDIVYALGHLAEDCAIQFEATDPYWYAAPTLDPSVGLPTPGIGFGFSFGFNLGFGGSTTPNTITATNSGDVPCYPMLVITGPCLNPTVTNQSIAGNPSITCDIQLNTGDQLVIDCDMQTVLYYPAGSNIGASRLNTLQPGFSFFSLVPGSNVVAFNSSDTTSVAATLALWYSSAYSSAT